MKLYLILVADIGHGSLDGWILLGEFMMLYQFLIKLQSQVKKSQYL